MRKFSTQKPFLLGMFLAATFFAQAQQLADTELKQLISKNAARLHLSATDINDAIINSSFADAATGLRYIYLQQGYQSIGVFNQVMTIALRNDVVAFNSGVFISDIATKVPVAQPNISSAEAVRKTAAYLSLTVPAEVNMIEDRFATDKKFVFGPSGIAKQNIEAKLVWVQEDDGTTVHLAWDVSIDVLGSPDWWNVRIDALSGEFVNKNNFTVYDRFEKFDDGRNDDKKSVVNPTILPLPATDIFRKKNTSIPPILLRGTQTVTSATYRVITFPNESPYAANPALDTNPWEKAGPGNPATTYGWHYDGTTYYDSTRGNNVHSYLDAANRNSPAKPNFSAVSTTPQPTLTFNYAPNFAVQPADSITRLHMITNLFYWNNLMHDVTYQYGFNEASGNFQFSNVFGETNRGGAGNDYVRAEAQDGSGTDNANFSTPADGSSGRMQMYLWSGPTDFRVTAPPEVAGSYFVKESGFSTNNKLKNIGTFTDTLVYYNDDVTGTAHYACGVPGTPANTIAGKIALIVRGGGCAGGFVEKVKNAQNAGASGVIMINNVPGLPITMGGTDNTITIPAIMISQDDGALLASRLGSVITVTMAAGPDRDGDVDNGVICHEYGHGISNRLTGGRTNANCLGNAEQGGEGWSDYFGLMMTTDWTIAQVTDGPKARPVGNYAEAYPVTGPGLRTYPYSTNMVINPHTYTDVATNTEVHAIGEVWCSAIWDMTWYIIQQENRISPNIYDTTGVSGTGGNIMAMKLVMEGMRLQTCRPGFLDARDAILAADSILYGYKHKCSIWNAFARRGMGVSAVQGLSTSATDQVAAFDIPNALLLTRSIVPATVQIGNNVTVNMNASCQCQVPVTAYVLDTIPAGFSYVSSSAGSAVSGNVVTFFPLNFTTVNETKTLSIVMKAAGPACAVTTSINDNRDGSTIGGLDTTALTGATEWVPSTTRFKSASNAWYAADVAGLRDFVLTSGAFTVGNLSILSFWHYFVLEDKLDGGRIEYSTNGGTTWLDAAPYILQNGYNDTTISTSPWGASQKVFTGVSYAQGSNQFINTLINFSSFSGQSIRIRFRMRTNATNASNQTYEGWFIDDITLNNGCGGLTKAVLINSAQNKMDSVYNPIFITPASLPLNLLSFTAKPVGKTVLLTWQTSVEINTKSFIVEHSTNRTLWSEAGTIAAKGSGGSTYVMYHQQPVEGQNYYRIKMIDKDGSFTYTDIRLVNFSAKGSNLFTIIPNPANTTATLYLDKNIKSGKLTVFDANGRTVQTLTVNNFSNDYQLETGKLAAGTYLVSIKTGTATQTGKLIVSH